MMRIGLATVIALALLAVAGCGGGTKTVTTTAPAGGTATTEEGEEGAATAPAEVVQIGEGKVLTGIQSNEKVKFTPLTYIDPVTPGQYDQPEGGQRLVAITWEMTNVGSATYDSSPGNGAVLILDDGTQVDHVITGSSTTECNYSSTLNLAPGESRKGCIPFEVGEEAKVKELQYALNSGYADQKGRWTLGG